MIAVVSYQKCSVPAESDDNFANCYFSNVRGSSIFYFFKILFIKFISGERVYREWWHVLRRTISNFQAVGSS